MSTVCAHRIASGGGRGPGADPELRQAEGGRVWSSAPVPHLLHARLLGITPLDIYALCTYTTTTMRNVGYRDASPPASD